MSFDEDSKNWDTEIRIKRAKKVAEEIANSIAADGSLSAMEFGCGTGLVSFNIYDKFKDITVVDSSMGMIDVVKTKIAKYKKSNVFPYCVDILKDNSFNKKFDIIYNSMVLHHIHDTNAVVKRLYNLLNVNGCLCIVDLDEEDGSFHKNYPDYDGHNGFNQEELKQILVNEGFSDVEVYTFYYDVKAIENQKVDYSLFFMKGRKL